MSPPPTPPGLPTVLAPGTKIDRYELVALLGEGGMAQVWAARQAGKHGFERLVALKTTHPRLAVDPLFHSMFLDEARIAAEIQHPNVAQVFDLGESGSMLYLVMEYVDGESLAALLGGIARRTGELSRVPAPESLRVVSELCAALSAAHEVASSSGALRGVVHRDVSPQNVLLSVNGAVKLIDFGIAHASDRVAGETGVDALKGKLQYMAPEQARRLPLGPYTDVWAAGALLYRLLAGRAPYEASTELETMTLLLSGAAPTPLPEDVPERAAAIVERAMSPAPGDRYASAAEMGAALEAAIGDEGLVPDVATWVRANLTDRYGERRAALAARDAAPVSSPGDVAIGKTMPSARRADLVAGSRAVPSLDVPERVPPEPSPAMDAEATDVHITLQSARSMPPSMAPAAAAQDEEPRSFMDVKAIAAERVAEATEKAEQRAAAKEEAPAPRQAPRSAKTAVQLHREQEVERQARKKMRRIAAAALGLALVLVVSVLALLPSLVKSRLLSSARAAGVDLTIADLGVSFSGVTIHGAAARAPDLHGVELTIAELHASGFSGAEISMTGVDVKLHGDAEELGASILRFYDAHRAHLSPATGTPSRRVTAAGAHVLWTDPFGKGSRVDAGDVGVEVASRAVGTEELKAILGRFEIRTQKAVLGPWSATLERSRQSTRVRVAFDPPLPDGPNAVYMWGPGTKPHLSVRIPRVPFAQIGVRPRELGIPAEPASEIDARLEAGVTPSQRVEGQGRIELYGARLRGWKQPVDVKVEASAAGAAGKPLDISRSTVNIGPFVAVLNGTVTPHERGLRLDASWKTQPILCERLAKDEAKRAGTFAATLQELAHSTGAMRVSGSAYATGLVKFDTAAPESASLTFQTRESCGVSLFGQP